MINFLRRTPLYPVLAGIYPRLHNFYIWLVWQICYLLPVDQHKIVFSNFNGGGFGDNARYIAEECIRRKISYKLYWVCSNPALPFPKELNLVPPNTAAFVYHMATAGCWVDTTRKLYYFKKKKNRPTSTPGTQVLVSKRSNVMPEADLQINMSAMRQRDSKSHRPSVIQLPLLDPVLPQLLLV